MAQGQVCQHVKSATAIHSCVTESIAAAALPARRRCRCRWPLPACPPPAPPCCKCSTPASGTHESGTHASDCCVLASHAPGAAAPSQQQQQPHLVALEPLGDAVGVVVVAAQRQHPHRVLGLILHPARSNEQLTIGATRHKHVAPLLSLATCTAACHTRIPRRPAPSAPAPVCHHQHRDLLLRHHPPTNSLPLACRWGTAPPTPPWCPPLHGTPAAAAPLPPPA